ncbi:MAG: lysophospholipid acyltransferase family protein [Syntrophothermus sp.]
MLSLNAWLNLFSHLPRGVRVPVARWAVNRAINHYAQLVAEGTENIPDTPVIFICNHLSNADGLILNKVLSRKREVVFLAGVKLQTSPVTRIAMETISTIPIQPNSPDRQAIKQAVNTLESGRSILIFPEGGRSRTGRLIRGKPGVVLIAKKAGVPIVPVGLQGTEILLPIDDRNMGGEKLHRAKVEVRVGKPFSLADLGGLARLQEPVERQGEEADKATEGRRNDETDKAALVDAMMLRIAALLDPEYRGEYA